MSVMEMPPQYGWATAVVVLAGLVVAIVRAVVVQNQGKQHDLDRIDRDRKATDNPSIGSMRRFRWRLRKRRD